MKSFNLNLMGGKIVKQKKLVTAIDQQIPELEELLEDVRKIGSESVVEVENDERYLSARLQKLKDELASLEIDIAEEIELFSRLLTRKKAYSKRDITQAFKSLEMKNPALYNEYKIGDHLSSILKLGV